MSEDNKPFYVPAEEQETVIQFSRQDDLAIIWTSDRTMITKYDKFVASGEWALKKADYVGSNIVAKEYIAPKALLFGRAKRPKSTMSEERKKQQAERMKAIRASQLSQNHNIS